MRRLAVALVGLGLLLAACNPAALQPLLDDGLVPTPRPTQHVGRSPVGSGTAYPLTHSWRAGCPVGPEDLVAVEFDHWSTDTGVDRGVLIVHVEVADAVESVVRELFRWDYALTSARPIDDFGGDDDASVAAGNSSAFNCRTIAGSSTWSEHSYGRAIDLNPATNPYLSSPPDSSGVVGALGARYPRPGVLVEGHAVVRAFDAIGWGWGGRWRHSKDYQHFSENGR